MLQSRVPQSASAILQQSLYSLSCAVVDNERAFDESVLSSGEGEAGI
jgi:hypothetical protein